MIILLNGDVKRRFLNIREIFLKKSLAIGCEMHYNAGKELQVRFTS